MKLKLIAMAVLIATSSGVWAATGGEGGNTGCNGQGNPNSPCEPTDNGGGSGTGGYGDIANNSSANSAANAASTAISNSTSSSKSGAVAVGVGGNSTSGASAVAGAGTANVSNSTSVRVDNGIDDYVASTNHSSPEPTAPCVVTGGAHFGVPGFIGGASGGVVVRNCEIRENIRLGLSSPNRDTRNLANEVLQAKLRQDLKYVAEEEAKQRKVQTSSSNEDSVWAFQNLGG